MTIDGVEVSPEVWLAVQELYLVHDVIIAVMVALAAALIALVAARGVVAVGDYRLRRRVAKRGPVSRPLPVIDPTLIPDPMQRYLHGNKGS